ncbi:MAG: hypothetical protein A2445_00585 [Candidatus Jacksonbacteria bacterium RIFOXYC2_FULL_44_29]|nr:MAG: hypothetical protein UW45_C0010G0026 [Parcubacteria group bacterium GW2011_GWC2_44_22]OGY76053.1 MAG: hypothetical protein A2295_03800 [Candidatus Jacksonbacteria bacterium RIFOXYB2_FULL_44_15]OGY76356.1 MAG: hypothetical protein A2240_04315 [Candidatus Jacksonbacteria bacterium RIFOXYA2_FULL_43_12]OGY77994.1 MAG: hypothetical protein A2445_00585 [Candidatus Jacksonbacteria bacterium RIFOXYC2_FULL_44_29]OGY80334.1 MAG: hypothetical protein A2550_04500 [Candidatus Jacksonbacteria bacteri
MNVTHADDVQPIYIKATISVEDVNKAGTKIAALESAIKSALAVADYYVKSFRLPHIYITDDTWTWYVKVSNDVLAWIKIKDIVEINLNLTFNVIGE